MITPEAFNTYLLWVIYAAVGQTAQADMILADKQHRELVLAGAAAQREAFPFESKTLYRGILLEPRKVFQSSIGPIVHSDDRLESVSYSEDLDVAQFFADKNSAVSYLVKKMKPKASGYIIERKLVEGVSPPVLFHHSWGRTGILMPPGMRPPWDKVKALPLGPPAHVQLGYDLSMQLMWSLRTQKEVILLQDGKALPVKDRSHYPSPSTEKLNDRYAPPFLESLKRLMVKP